MKAEMKKVTYDKGVKVVIDSESLHNLLRYFPEYAEALEVEEHIDNEIKAFHKEVRCEEEFAIETLYYRGHLVREEVRYSNGRKDVEAHLPEKCQQYKLLMKMTNQREQVFNGLGSLK